MKSKKFNNTAISLINPRETALYFDYVVPLNLGLDMLLRGITPGQIHDAFPPGCNALLPPSLNTTNFVECLIDVNIAFWHWVIKYYSWMHKHQPEIQNSQIGYKDIPPEEFGEIAKTAIDAFALFVNDYDIMDCAIDVPEILVKEKDGSEDILVSVLSLNVIDASKASWEHVLEFRRSEKAKASLRRFRLFAFNNYKGKDRSFIEDDIHMRLDEYSNTISEWGFETKHAAMCSLLSSKVLAGAFTGSFISSLLGQPLPAILSATGGLVLEVGSIALNIQKRSFELRKIIRDSPVTYIHEAKQIINKGQQSHQRDGKNSAVI